MSQVHSTARERTSSSSSLMVLGGGGWGSVFSFLSCFLNELAVFLNMAAINFVECLLVAGVEEAAYQQ
jgi:hypothetical protein